VYDVLLINPILASDITFDSWQLTELSKILSSFFEEIDDHAILIAFELRCVLTTVSYLGSKKFNWIA